MNEVIDAETGAIVLITPTNVDKSTAVTLQNGFQPFFAAAESLRERALAVTVTDADDTKGMKEARGVRLQLKEVRVSAKKVHKSLKEESLRTGKAIDGLYNLLVYRISPLEEALDEQETYALRKQEERIQARREERASALIDFEYTHHTDLAALTEEAFASVLADAKDLHELRQSRARRDKEERQAAAIAAAEAQEERLAQRQAAADAAAKAQEEHLGQLAKEAAEQEERLKAETAKRKAAEAALAKERAEAESKRKAVEAALAKERAEAESKASAFKAAETARLHAEEKAAQAPDREKLESFARNILTMVPTVSSKEGKRVAKEIASKVEALAAWVAQQAATL